MKSRLLLALACALLPSPVLAHHAEWMTEQPFLQGLSMPLHGIDHVLVAVAVGLMAAELGGAALWGVPSVFAFFLLIAGLLNVSGIAVPAVEPAILGSVLFLGGILARGRPLPLLLCWIAVGVLAVIQGSALFATAAAPGVGSILRLSAGCLASATGLLATGIGMGLLLRRLRRGELVRIAGGAIIAAGVLVYVSPSANEIVIRLLERSG